MSAGPAASQSNDESVIPGIDRARLAQANINPMTGLGTGYLNHFKEAIMVLEVVSAMPDWVEDFIGWDSMTYCEHFAGSSFKERKVAIVAYENAGGAARRQLDELSDT